MVQISNAVFLNRFVVSLACSSWYPLTYHMLTERWYGVGENWVQRVALTVWVRRTQTPD